MRFLILLTAMFCWIGLWGCGSSGQQPKPEPAPPQKTSTANEKEKGDYSVQIKRNTPEMAVARALFTDGKNQMKAGFIDAGFQKIREAAHAAPLARDIRYTHQYVKIAGYIPSRLSLLGDLLLSVHRQLKTGLPDPHTAFTKDQKWQTLWALYRLIDFGMFAQAAGHPGITAQTADAIRRFADRYSDLWIDPQAVDKTALLLEALALSAQQGPDAAYAHMLANGGLTTDAGSKKIVWVYLENFPAFFSTLFSDRKKMAYLVKVSEPQLPWPAADDRFPPQEYPDLDGNTVPAIGGSAPAEHPKPPPPSRSSPPETETPMGTVLE